MQTAKVVSLDERRSASTEKATTDAFAVFSVVCSATGIVIASIDVVLGSLLAMATILFAILTVASGALALLLCAIGAVLGMMSVKRIEKRPNQLTGRGLAMVGAIAGLIGAVIAVVAVALPLVLGGLSSLISALLFMSQARR